MFLDLKEGEDWTFRYYRGDRGTTVEFSKTSVYQGEGIWDERLQQLVLVKGNLPESVISAAETVCKMKYP